MQLTEDIEGQSRSLLLFGSRCLSLSLESKRKLLSQEKVFVDIAEELEHMEAKWKRVRLVVEKGMLYKKCLGTGLCFIDQVIDINANNNVIGLWTEEFRLEWEW